MHGHRMHSPMLCFPFFYGLGARPMAEVAAVSPSDSSGSATEEEERGFSEPRTLPSPRTGSLCTYVLKK